MARTWILACMAATLSVAYAACQRNTTATTVAKSHEAQLTVFKPMSETIKPGDRGSVDVRVNRTNFNGPVTLALSDLPAGVHVASPALIIPAKENKLTIALSAEPGASAVKDHVVSVRASANGLASAETFKITIESGG